MASKRRGEHVVDVEPASPRSLRSCSQARSVPPAANPVAPVAQAAAVDPVAPPAANPGPQVATDPVAPPAPIQ